MSFRIEVRCDANQSDACEQSAGSLMAFHGNPSAAKTALFQLYRTAKARGWKAIGGRNVGLACPACLSRIAQGESALERTTQ